MTKFQPRGYCHNPFS